MRILVVNAGSSSLKLRLLGPDDAPLAEADVPAPRAEVDERLRHRAYTREHGDDPRGVRDWTWPGERRQMENSA